LGACFFRILFQKKPSKTQSNFFLPRITKLDENKSWRAPKLTGRFTSKDGLAASAPPPFTSPEATWHPFGLVRQFELMPKASKTETNQKQKEEVFKLYLT